MNDDSNFDLITARVHCVTGGLHGAIVSAMYRTARGACLLSIPITNNTNIASERRVHYWGQTERRAAEAGAAAIMGWGRAPRAPLGVQYVISSVRSGRTITERGQAYGGDETWQAGGSKERDGVSAVRRVEEDEELPNSDGWQDARLAWWLDDGEDRELQRQGGEICRNSRVDTRGLRWHSHLSCDGSIPGGRDSGVQWSRRATHADQRGSSEQGRVGVPNGGRNAMKDTQ